MRLGPIVHGLLLIVALLFAYRTFTHEEPEEKKTGDVQVWNEPADSFQSLTFTSENKDVLIERRGKGKEAYLWGKVTRTHKKVSRPQSFPGHSPMPGHGMPGHGMPGHPMPGHPPAPGKGAAPGAAKPAPIKKPAAPVKKPVKKPAAAKKPAPAKKPAAKGDGSKANQNDPIPPAKPAANKASAKPAKPAKPAASKAGAKPAKPAANKAGAKPVKPAGAKPADAAKDGAAKDGAAGGSSSDAATSTSTKASAEPEMVTTVREFPVGKAGSDLVDSFSKLRALQELGALDDDDKVEYGLSKSKDRLTVKFAGGKEHTLVVGDRVYGGSERYVLDETSGKGYVLAAEVMRDVEAAETSLGLKKYHDFDIVEDLQRFAVQVEGTEQVLVRLEMQEDQEGEPEGLKPAGKKEEMRKTWARLESPDQEDVTMANFVDRVSKLRPIDYKPDLDASKLTKMARFSYQDKGGKELGYMILYKGPKPDAKPDEEAKNEYYMKTEKTRVLGRVSRLTAERVDSDLTEVFSGFSSSDDGATPANPGKKTKDAPPTSAPPTE